jgi:hypothetical protein
MFTELFFKQHSDIFKQHEDRWMQCFLQLHVPNNYSTDRDFKLAAVENLRKSNVYKVTKLSAEHVEKNLLESQELSVASFCALAHLYKVNIAILLGNMYIVVGDPLYYVDCHGDRRVKRCPSSHFNDLFRVVLPGKPLNALTYYSANDLEIITSKLRLPKGSKSYMYNGIKSYLLTALN